MIDLKDGESTEMKGSGKKPYTLKNVGGVYSCSCPAWRNQSVPIDLRTCKHIIKLRGEQAERSRLGDAFPEKGKKVSRSPRDKTTQLLGTVEKWKPPLLLAHSWDNATNPAGWWMSEKLDGVRAYWNGKDFISRLGNVYHAPDWFKKGLPNHSLDGELWVARGQFQKCVSIVRRQDKSEHWKEVTYVVFDAPGYPEVFEQRMAYLEELTLPSHVEVLKQMLCVGFDHLKKHLSAAEALGGEGLMLRKAGSNYEEGRSMTLLKVKTFYDAEARVVGHKPGKGRHKGRLGALECENNGITFKVGTGFSDYERENPPAIGTLITYRYQELTNDGVPRFPSYVRERTDLL
jgi:DNA ligase-1